MATKNKQSKTDAPEIEHDALTGEIVEDVPETFALVRPDLSAAALAALEAAEKADDEAFAQKTSDFWKPSQPGEKLTGIYLGTEKVGRLNQHMFGVKDAETGEPMVKRMNGSRIINKELSRGEIGQIVRLTFDGTGTTQAGNKLNMFSVAWFAKQ